MTPLRSFTHSIARLAGRGRMRPPPDNTAPLVHPQLYDKALDDVGDDPAVSLPRGRRPKNGDQQ